MRAWIVHDSKFGNGELVAKILGSVIDGEVKVGHNKEISPRSVVEASPDLLIIGNAVRMFRMSSSSKRWLKKLHTLMRKKNKTIKFGCCFVTHMREPDKIEKHVIKFHDYFRNMDCMVNVFPEYILAQVQDIEGPLNEGVLEEISIMGNELVEWTKLVAREKPIELY
ncbi:MAG: hypothetical protein ACXAB7_08600 [Candidatus Kariarchaeaceae archaeon]|jgi:menaquinone-dependent protoporphyrinogen IX oxidase